MCEKANGNAIGNAVSGQASGSSESYSRGRRDIVARLAALGPDEMFRAVKNLVVANEPSVYPNAAPDRDCDVESTQAISRPGAVTLGNVERVFTYQAWDRYQISQAEPVKEAILALARAILRHVPDCPDRSVAVRKLRELRMDVNSAITHRGEF